MLGDENEEDALFEKSAELVETEEQIGELLKTKDRTAEQEAKLKDLKKKRSGEFNKRLGEVVGEKKFYEHRAKQLEQELAELKRKPEEKPQSRTTNANRSKVTVYGEEHYTDVAIRSMIEDGEITQEEGWQMQQERIAAMAAEKKEKRDGQKEFEKVKQDTINEVLAEYPHFSPAHPRHNPNDPLYKEASRILGNGYASNPRGIKMAIDEAKKILRINEQRPDLADDFSVAGSRMAGDRSKSSKKIELEEWEKDNAVRMYNKSGLVNPKTGKTYTETEAVEKALIAKTKRAEQTAGRS